MSERTLHERPVVIRGYKFIKLKSGRMLTFWDAVDAYKRAHTDLVRALSRVFKLADGEYDLERIEWLVAEMEEHARAVRVHLDNVRGVQTKRERIALLRNTTGRTPEEAEAFRRKADELEGTIE